jgi:hypothetical protein
MSKPVIKALKNLLQKLDDMSDAEFAKLVEGVDFNSPNAKQYAKLELDLCGSSEIKGEGGVTQFLLRQNWELLEERRQYMKQIDYLQKRMEMLEGHLLDNGMKPCFDEDGEYWVHDTGVWEDHDE